MEESWIKLCMVHDASRQCDWSGINKRNDTMVTWYRPRERYGYSIFKSSSFYNCKQAKIGSINHRESDRSMFNIQWKEKKSNNNNNLRAFSIPNIRFEEKKRKSIEYLNTLVTSQSFSLIHEYLNN